MKKFLLILALVVAAISLNAQAITGGAGICFTDADPNTVAAIQDPADSYTCHFVVDRTNDKVYVYDIGTTTWVEWTSVDQDITNEGSLTVGAGTASNSLIQSNTSGSTDVTIEAGTGLSIAEAGNTITLTNTVTDTKLTQEEVEDFAFDAARFGTGTQTLITVTYDDINNNVDFVVDANLSSYNDDLGHVEESTTVSDGNTIDFTLTGTDITAEAILSADAGNRLTTGTDNALHVPAEVDGSITNEIQNLTWTENSSTDIDLDIDGTGSTDLNIQLSGLTGGVVGQVLTLTAPAGSDDQNLTVDAGTATTSIINIEDGTDVTIEAGTGLSIAEAGSTITLTNTVTDTKLTQEEVEDFAFDAARFGTGTQTLITVTYDDINNNVDFVVDANLSNYTDDLGHVEESTTVTDSENGLDIVLSTYDITVAPDISEAALQAPDVADLLLYEDVTDGGHHSMSLTQLQTAIDTDTKLTQEEVEDFAFDAARFGTGTQTLITVTYDDVSNNVDFVVEANLSNYTNDAGFLTSEVDGSITNEGSLTVTAGTSTTSVISSNTSGSTDVTLTAGTGMSISEVGNVITLESTVVGEATTVTDSANGMDIVETGDDITVALDIDEVANQAPDVTDLLIYEDITDGNMHHMTLTQLQTAINTNTHIMSTDLTSTGARTQTLVDNTASAMTFGATGATGIFTIITTDAGEGVDMAYDLTVDGDVVLGDASGDALTLNSAAITAPNIPEYDSRTAADAALAAGVLWKTSTTNSHGLPQGVVFVAN